MNDISSLNKIIKVSIIIINYNGSKFLCECIDSVLNQSIDNFEIIIVDNASTDNSLDLLNSYKDNRIRVFPQTVNLGFTGGNNTGYKYCSGKYIVLLNNDTVVEKTWLDNLVKIFENYPETGIVQSLVLTEGIPDKYYKKNGSINFLGHNIMEIFDIEKNGVGEIFQATGCSMMFEKKLIDSFGFLFLNEYFAYAEDTFLCFRVKFCGLGIIHNAKSVVYHKGGATVKAVSSGLKSGLLAFYRERNRILNFLLFFSKGFIFKISPYLILNFFAKFIAGIFIKKYSSFSIIKAYLWIIKNKNLIKKNRKILQEQYVKKENYVIGYLTCKLFNGNNIFGKFFNGISKIYCRIIGIRTVEFIKH
ncbi:MAG: glycosyltransferase family 2 protein [Ignavibacteria bacterium]|nr:glycosyltransferase family 2 protein [Ignavibacteria bacterium]